MPEGEVVQPRGGDLVVPDGAVAGVDGREVPVEAAEADEVLVLGVEAFERPVHAIGGGEGAAVDDAAEVRDLIALRLR